MGVKWRIRVVSSLDITSDVFPPMGTLVQQLGFSVDEMWASENVELLRETDYKCACQAGMVEHDWLYSMLVCILYHCPKYE